MDQKELIRTFICIEMPDSVIKEAARIQGLLENVNFTGKITELENLHLTLKFLGEIDGEKLEKVKEKLGRIKFKGFEAKLGEIGVFRNHGEPKIVWIKIEGKGIWELQKRIDEALKNLFPEEERFMSHMTIARVKYVKDKNGLIEYVKNIHAKEIKFKIEKFLLKKSDLGRSGPVYTSIEEYD